MPAPLGIAAIAAARALSGAAGKRVIGALEGKKSAAKYAAAKSAANAKAKSAAMKKAADKKAFKEIAKKKPLATPKSAVRVKPPAKTVGNPPNNIKAWESVLSSASRGGVGRTMGKTKDARVANSKKPTGKSK